MIYIHKIEIDREELLRRGSYVAKLPAFKELDYIRFDSPVTIFVGENGSGKSTLIEGIAVAAGLNPEGGSANFSFSTKATHSELCDAIKLIRGSERKWKDSYFLRAESLYNVATYIDELDEIPSPSRHIKESYGGISLHNVSHGESFMALMRERLGGNGLYLFDEPEAALSPSRIIAMIGIIKRLVDEDSQIIIATHSPILAGYPGAAVFEIGENGIRRVEWRSTENYIVTKRFLEHPEYFLEIFS